jgi:hypothetical protein
LTFFHKRNEEGLEDRLRSLSGEPREDFVRELSGEIRASRVPAVVRSRRFVAALVTTALVVVPFVAFGGVHYAAAAAKGAAQAVSNNGGGNGNGNGNGNANANGQAQGGTSVQSNVQQNTPAGSQYRPGWGCGDPNHDHTGPPGNPGATSPCK